jgi:hypothetical protein
MMLDSASLLNLILNNGGIAAVSVTALTYIYRISARHIEKHDADLLKVLDRNAAAVESLKTVLVRLDERLRTQGG